MKVHTKIPSLSQKEHVILTLLVSDAREWYGLELVDASEGKLKRGTVYVTLGRMQDKGYVESRREEIVGTDATIPRRLYKPTGLGKSVLNAYEQFANTFGLTPSFAQ